MHKRYHCDTSSLTSLLEFSLSSFRSSDVIRSGDSLSVDFSVPDDARVRRLEHVEVVANIEYPVRGALEVALVSPKGEKKVY